MSTSFALLGLLEREPSHGYDLKRDYDRLFAKDKPLAFGQVYATLARLSRDLLIDTLGPESGGGPDRKKYSITETGESRLFTWLQSPEAPHPSIQTTLFIKTVLAILLDRDANHYLDRQRTAHIARMRELTRQKRTGGFAEKLLIDHAIFHLEADLRWIDMTAARLSQLAKEIE